MSKPRHVLVFSPAFHGYWRSIAAGFEANGHRVTTHTYDAHSGIAAKVHNKVVYEGFERLHPGAGIERQASSVTARAIAKLQDVRPDAVVVVKGDLFDDPFWDLLDGLRVPRVLWLYDEIRRTRHERDALGHRGPIASYSPEDVASLRADGVDAHVVPLAFDPACTGPPIDSPDVVFIGARYPQRSDLLTAMYRLGVPIRVVGRDWSPRVVDRLRTWSWRRPELPAQTAVSRSVAAGMMAGALAALNIHGDQDGFTMRTFEAAGVGALQLIDRADVGMHYEPGTEVLVFADAGEAAELVERARREPVWAARIAEAARKRTLAEHTFAHRARLLEERWG